MTPNGFSIVIATKGRVTLLEELLQSVHIARQNYLGESEVLLVDDSNPADVVLIESLCQRYAAQRIEHGPSVPEKRNVGATAAQYDTILFLDSDCIATPNLLAEHAKHYQSPKVGAVAGPLEFVGEDTWFWRAVEKTPFVICFSFPQWMDEVPWTPTANCSIKKSVFQEVHGFDRSFPDKPGGEDVDLGLRITKAGYSFRCSKEALVYHSKKTWIPVKDMVKRLWYYGSANYYLAEKHRDHTMKVMPRKSLIYLFGLFMLLFTAIISPSPWLLAAAPLWILIDLSISSLCVNAFVPYKRTDFLHQLVVQLLILDNELGYVVRCIQKRKFSYLLEDVVYFDGQLDGLLDNGAIGVWSHFLSLIVLFLMIYLA